MTIKPLSLILGATLFLLAVYLFGYCRGNAHGTTVTEIKNHILMDSIAKKKDSVTVITINGTTVHDTLYKLKVEYRNNEIKLTELQRNFQKQLDSLKKTKRDSIFITKLKIVYDSSQTIRLCDTPQLQITVLDTIMPHNGIHIKSTISTLGYLLGEDVSATPAYVKPLTSRNWQITGYGGTSVGIGLNYKEYSAVFLKSVYSKHYEAIIGYTIKF